jgi:hypothetical protein
MIHPELTAQFLKEQRRDWLAEAEHSRHVALASGPRVTISRRAATSIGRMMLRMGAGLLRYGCGAPRPATRPYYASARSIRLN